jgi:hypothetical protein
MRLEGNVSKVAICTKCNKHIKAGHVDYLDEESEREFTELTNEGYLVKLETVEETRGRELGFYSDCSKGLCKLSPEKLKPTHDEEPSV